MIETTFIVDKAGAEEVLGKLSGLLAGPGMAAFLKTTVEPYFQEKTQQIFDMQGNYVDGPWAPLTEATQGYRESAGFDPEFPINVRTGAMEKWATQSEGSTRMLGAFGAVLTYPGRQPRGLMGKKVKVAQLGQGKAPRQGENRGGYSRTAGMGGGSHYTPKRPIFAVDEFDMLFVMSALNFQVMKLL